jgi:L,D-peptidoglycan transpeptidase YkuD (ErfK/YbiS/YcfS/YnhG family)
MHELSRRSHILLTVALMLPHLAPLGGCEKDPPPTLAARRAAEAAQPTADRTQLVTVVSDRWNDFRATLRRYEREPGQRWRPVGQPIDVVLGREGYAWGRGLHGNGAPTGRPGPIKREGDERSPAGVFAIGRAYGYAATPKDLALPYEQATADMRCIDDPRSSHYNRIVSIRDTEVDWKSAERMHRDDDLYVLTVVVEHNTQATKANAGSCIFLHLWRGPNVGMSGCTAMSMSALQTLASWLQPDATALVALPRSEYEALRRPWSLPVVPLPGQYDRASEHDRRRPTD